MSDHTTVSDRETKPEEFADSLSEYGPVIHDPICGEPVGWGFRIREYIGEARWPALGKYGDLECIDPRYGKWVLVTKWLTREEAEAQFGKDVTIERGPAGGRRSITFGTTQFNTQGAAVRLLRPEEGGRG